MVNFMIKYPPINKRSQLRMWLNKNEYEFITNSQLTLLEECEYCEVDIIEPEFDLGYYRDHLHVYVHFKKNGDIQDKWSRTYLFNIRRGELQ